MTSMSSQLVKAGEVYRHHKGTLYQVVCITKDSETLEPRVVYKALGGDGTAWDRPQSMWHDQVLWWDGHMRPRFVLEG
jgi:hypothetical protein